MSFTCQDVRVYEVEVQCRPVKDPDAVLSLVIRDEENGMAIAAGLSPGDARALAEYIVEELGL